MTYNKLKELVDLMLVRDTFDADKIPDILQKVVRYGGKEKLTLLIDLLSCDIVYGTAIVRKILHMSLLVLSRMRFRISSVCYVS